MADLVYLLTSKPSNTRLFCKKINLLVDGDLDAEKLPARAGSERGNASQIAGLLEGEISAPLRVGLHVADNHVIQQFDFENLGGLPQRAGWRVLTIWECAISVASLRRLKRRILSGSALLR